VSDFFAYLVPGITDGSIYAIIALGLVLTYKTSGVFNFAHGGVAAVAAYLFYQFHILNGWGWPISFALSLVLVGLIGGLLLERIAYWLTGAPTVTVVMATVGLLVLLQSACTAKYGSADLKTGEYLPKTDFALGRVSISVGDIIIIILALATAGGLFFLFNTTRTGKAMTAVVDDDKLLSLNGINPSSVRRLAWVLGSSFAAMSGMLVAQFIGVSVNQLILLVIAGYGAAAIGYFRSLPLTVAGGFIVGILVNEGELFFKRYDDVLIQSAPRNLPFVVLFAVLVFVPVRYLTQQGARNVRRFKPIKDYGRVPTAVGLSALGLLLVLTPQILEALDKESDLTSYCTALGLVIIFASLGLITYTSGQISLCHMGFAAIGASTTGNLLDKDVPFVLAILLAALVTAPAAAIVAIPAIRLSGIYIAIATFGFAILLQRFLYLSKFMFGSDQLVPIPRPEVLGVDLTNDKSYYYFSLIFVIFALGSILVVRRSRLGQLLRALSDSPAALEAHGANTTVTRVLVFVFSAFLAGLGGAIIAGSTQTASGAAGGDFDFTVSLVIVAVLGFCGRRPVLSPIIAASLYQLLTLYGPFASDNFIKTQGIYFGAAALLVAITPGLGVGRLGTDQRSQSRDGAGLGGQFAQRLDPVRPPAPIQPRRPQAAKVGRYVPAAGHSSNVNGNGHGARQPAGRGTRVR
jgi:branched-subunit amino acid ABC-type transport system permease component